MTFLEQHMTSHYDALGAALLVALVAVIAIVCIVVHYDRQAARRLQWYRDRLTTVHETYQKLLDSKRPSRRLTVDEAAAQAERLTRHDGRTALQEASGELTMERPRPERPIWTSGGAV